MNVIFFAINKTLGRTHDETLTTWFIYKQDALLAFTHGIHGIAEGENVNGDMLPLHACYPDCSGPCNLSLDNSNESFYTVGI